MIWCVDVREAYVDSAASSILCVSILSSLNVACISNVIYIERGLRERGVERR